MEFKYLNTARKNINYTIDSNLLFDIYGIRADNGIIRFPRKSSSVGREQFDTIKQCQEWLRNFGAKMDFEPNTKLNKVTSYSHTKAIKIADNDKALIASMMPSSNKYDLEKDIQVFESYLANNIKDRDGERFAKSVLTSLSKTIVGKKDLMSHNWSHPGTGKVYKARLESMSVDEALEFIGGHPEKNFRKQLEEVVKRDGAIHWLVTNYYLPNVTDAQKEAVINIELGIWDAMSIGFRAPAYYAIFSNGDEEKVSRNMFGYNQNSDDKRELLFLEYRNDGNFEAEALEQSHVGVPAQYGASTTKEYEDKIKALQNRIEKLEKQPDIVQDIKDEEIKFYVEKLDEITDEKATWTAAFINDLPDAAFAVIESGGEKDEEGKTTPRNLRHLPHHNNDVVRSTENNSVDLPHLRNALARVDQTQAVSDQMTTATLRSKAKSHLIAHAKALSVGNYDEYSNNTNQKRSKEMNFKIDEMGINITFQEDDVEASVKTLKEKIIESYKNEMQKKDAEIETLKTELTESKENLDQAVNEMNAYKDELDGAKKTIDEVQEVIGKDLSADSVKELKEQANAYRESLIEDAIKYGCLSGIVVNDEETVKTKKDELSKMENAVIKFWLKSYREVAEKTVGGSSQVIEEPEVNEKKTMRLANYSSI